MPYAPPTLDLLNVPPSRVRSVPTRGPLRAASDPGAPPDDAAGLESLRLRDLPPGTDHRVRDAVRDDLAQGEQIEHGYWLRYLWGLLGTFLVIQALVALLVALVGGLPAATAALLCAPALLVALTCLLFAPAVVSYPSRARLDAERLAQGRPRRTDL